MWSFVKTSLTLGALAAATASATDPIKVEIINQCAEDFDLSHLGAGTIISVEKFASGGTKTKSIPMESHSQLFKAGTGAQATLAEITVAGGKVWLDISIIPTGRVGPGHCMSFDECKRVTGGHSYNYPMQIIPSQGPSGQFPTCKSITCMYDGCPEAYLFPDDKKTMVCPGDTNVKVIFCPGGPGGKTDPPTPPPTTPAPTTPEPTTPEPTPSPAATENSVLTSDGFLGGSGSGNGTVGEDRSLDLEAGAATPAPTEAPAASTEAVVVAGAPQPEVVEVTTKSEASTSAGAGLYVMLSVGAAAMVAGAAIFVLRKKKMALEALDEKTPRPTTTRATNAFALTTPQETTVL